MKKIILTFLLLNIFNSLNAQKELWGVSQQTLYADEQGNIVKFDMNGENAVTVHHFNFPTGKLPSGKLFLASNGKLYGTATYGGIGSTTATYEQDGYGVLYEYNIIYDTYRVVHYFNYISPTDFSINPTSGLIEPIPGKLYGGTKGGSFYVYDIAIETVITLNHNYSFDAMGGIYSDLIKASNGFVYAVSGITYPCTAADPLPNRGTVIKINTSTNSAQRVASFACVGSDGEGSSGTLVEALPNKIFFNSSSGYQFLPLEGFVYPAGTIVEFNTLNNTLTRKFTFDAFNNLGFNPSSFVLNNNGNLYGVCNIGGNTFRSPYTTGILTTAGTLFEYNPITNSIVKLTEFLPFQNLPQTIIKLTTGELVGNLGNGSIFKYNINSNELQFPDLATYSDFPNQYFTQNLIEICRKPSYQEILVNSFTVATGANFTYDVQNTNASSYQWQLGGATVVGQTTGVLNITNATTANAGNYTCVMTNECGTTTTAPLTVNVSNLGINNVDISLIGIIKLYPNPTNTFINIELPKNINVIINEVKINDILGKEIYNSSQNNTKIDVSGLAKGIYIVKLKSNYGNWNGKFVKE